MRRLNEPSHLDLRCLTFSLSLLHISSQAIVCLNKNADDKCRLKFGIEELRKLYFQAYSRTIIFGRIETKVVLKEITLESDEHTHITENS